MRINIVGMTCDMCKEAVSKALKKVEGVKDVTVNLEEGYADVEGNFDLNAIKKAIESIGFEAL